MNPSDPLSSLRNIRLQVFNKHLPRLFAERIARISVYLRLLDVPVPVIYGRSADENPFV